MEENNGSITIDDVEYKLTELSQECIAELDSLQFCLKKLDQLNYEIAAITTAKNAYAMQLQSLLPKETAAH